MAMDFNVSEILQLIKIQGYILSYITKKRQDVKVKKKFSLP